jgi:hypothetical protein
MIVIACFTRMRPINNWALMWEEVTLDPVKGTGNFELDQHKNVNKQPLQTASSQNRAIESANESGAVRGGFGAQQKSRRSGGG